MKVTLDVKDSKVPFFMELMKSLDFVQSVSKVEEERKVQFANDLTEAFHEVKLYEQGKKKLRNAKDFINELRSQDH